MSLLTKATWFARYWSFFSSIEDVRAYSKLRRNQTPAPEEVELSVRRGAGARLLCRAGTSDAEVLWDVFWGGYHLPTGVLPEKPVIFDLGANVGYSCFDLGTLFPDARLFGVEMDYDNVRVARQNTVALGSRCEIFHAAVWYEDGEVKYAKSDEEWGYHIAEDGDGQADVTVRAVSIDTLMREVGVDWIDYVKMDIEGAEDDVIVAGAAWLQRTGELSIELHAPATYEKCSEILIQAGFTCTPSPRHKNSILATRTKPVS